VDKAGYQNRVGEVVHWYTEALANFMENSFKEDTAKAALQGSWTTGVVRIQPGTNKKGEYKYSDLDIDNGDLVITIYQLANVGDGFSGLIDKLGDSSSGLSVKASQNLKEKEEERNEALQKIHENVQLSCDVTLDCDYPAFAAKVDKDGYKDRLGEVIQWYVQGLGENVERNFKNDDLARSALQAAWTTGVLRIEVGTNKKGEYKYNSTDLRDGDLIITVFSMSNTSDTGNDLISKLSDPASGLSLDSSLNIHKHEESKEENVKKIQDAVGLSADVTLDVDWSVLDTASNAAGYKNRCGEVVYNWILGGLAGNLERICKDDLTKEAVAEVWTTGVIRFEENKKISYHAVEFVNGDLIIQYKPTSIASNVSDVGSDIEKKL